MRSGVAGLRLHVSRAGYVPNPNLERIERKISFTGPDWSDREDEVIRLDAETLTWRSIGSFGEAREMAREVARRGRLQEKVAEVWEALPQSPPGLTYAQLVDFTGLSRDRVREAIAELGERAARSGNPRGSRSNPLRFWRTGGRTSEV